MKGMNETALLDYENAQDMIETLDIEEQLEEVAGEYLGNLESDTTIDALQRDCAEMWKQLEHLNYSDKGIQELKHRDVMMLANFANDLIVAMRKGLAEYPHIIDQAEKKARAERFIDIEY